MTLDLSYQEIGKVLIKFIIFKYKMAWDTFMWLEFSLSLSFSFFFFLNICRLLGYWTGVSRAYDTMVACVPFYRCSINNVCYTNTNRRTSLALPLFKSIEACFFDSHNFVNYFLLFSFSYCLWEHETHFQKMKVEPALVLLDVRDFFFFFFLMIRIFCISCSSTTSCSHSLAFLTL